MRSGVRIIAVTKGHPVEAVKAAIAVGLTECGENRVAELSDKVETLGRHAAHWHLIGHLQRNKVKQAIELFDLVHSIDSVRLARELSDEAVKAGIKIRGLIQVNASGEETKGGIDVHDDISEAAFKAVQEIVELPNVEVHGLMTMAPFVDDVAILRATFSRTRRFLEACAERFNLAGRELSMGMSNDFEIAVEEGSTMVRLGTILFGERNK
ncbi:MAG TPA: YggS family pyridoxal phosphate-dependent enzyme [Longimicrobiales bacterium]|nr:YggS family pyridoxal phosphate-dependent enzyme [Longimicrobiales bacterium]